MQMVIVNGQPTSGKTKFIELCLEELKGRGEETSSIDYVKHLATEHFNWDGKKTPKSRKFLSDLKDLLTEWDDIPYKKILKAFKAFEYEFEQFGVNHDDAVFFVTCREPKEIQKFKDRLDAKTLLIRRAVVESSSQSNHADSNVFNYKYDYVINNNGNLNELKGKAKGFLQLIRS